MSDNPNGQVLDYLREQFARVNVKLDRLTEDVTNLKVRATGMEAEMGYVRIGLAEVNSRLDRLDARVALIERRLDLTDVPAH
jgi:hypothetical protein